MGKFRGTARPMSFLSRFRRNVIAFPLAALAALAMLAISEASYQDATSSLDKLGERAAARTQLNDLVKSLLDAETGQRGYLLTDRREYLEPYEQAQAETRKTLAWLNDYYAKDPETAAADGRGHAGDRGQAERARDHDRDARPRRRERAWRELMLSDIGREKMEHVRTARRAAARPRDGRRSASAGAASTRRSAEPHRRLGDGGAEPARALHVPAPDRDARPRPADEAAAHARASATGWSPRWRRARRS